MKKIINNYLCFSDKKDFNQKTLNYFFDRLSIFLNVVIKDKPQLRLLKTRFDSRASYRDNSNTVTFTLDEYAPSLSKFQLDVERIKLEVPNYQNYYYIVPLCDIYHELIHAYQYFCTEYKWNGFIEQSDGFIEAAAETFTMILSGESFNDYPNEVYALWFIMKRKLGIKKATEQYNFIRRSVVKSDFVNQLMGYPVMKELVDKKYKGSIENFLNSFVTDFGGKKYYKECIADIAAMHDLIFYQW